MIAMPDWFSETVPEASARFEAAAARAGARLRLFIHPLPDPSGRAIGSATALLGPASAERLVVVVSGTHGIEGHTGSAIQTAWLETSLHRMPKDTAVLLLHLVNPWGCAWNRRENEDNVDIFRNLLYSGPDFPENQLYDRYERGINPRSWTGPEREEANRLYQEFVDAHGADAVVATIRRGQHNHPKGITFNGCGPTWSSQMVRGVGEEMLRCAHSVEVLDIHTGFGDFGDAMIIPCDAPGSQNFASVERRFPDLLYRWGEDALIPQHPRGPYHLWEEFTGAGTINNFGLEFGTYDVGERFELFRANTFIHTYGDPRSDFGQQIAAEYRETFYPADPRWRARVLEAGLDAVERTVAG